MGTRLGLIPPPQCHLSTYIPIFLTAPVVITENPSPSEIPLLVGETATLSCAARSIPRPEITWFRVTADNRPPEILSTSSPNIDVGDIENLPNYTNRAAINVTVMGEEDFAAYFCVADNGFNNANSTETTLIRAGKREPLWI